MTASDKRVQTDEELYSGAYGYIPCCTSVVLVYTGIYQYIEVYTSIYLYMTEQTIHTVIYNDKPCTKTYITVYVGIAGFRGAHRDATLRDAVEPPRPLGSDSEQQHEDMNPDPCPEDEEFFNSPDAESMEEAISRFMEGMERQYIFKVKGGV
jgi:hypothetical protein